MRVKLIHILIVFLAFHWTSCSDKQIRADSIMIKKVNKHPFLIDHDRKLIVKNGRLFNYRMDLYGDPGVGCNSHLSENDSAFVLIDCNGEWYSIDKNSGKISSIGWRWNEDFPERFVGVFIRSDDEQFYELSDSHKVIYRFKDPDSFP